MPITGSFSRSAVNHASGVQTSFGGVITGKFIQLVHYSMHIFIGFGTQYENILKKWKSNMAFPKQKPKN